MRTPTLAILTGLCAATLFVAAPQRVRSTDAQTPATGSSEDKPILKYLGVKACGSCHKSKATGNQIEAWKATAHARAYATLGTEAASQVAKKAGISTDPQLEARCLVCHTTAAGEPKSHLGEDFDVTQGVQCEACHGPGSEYSVIQHMIKHATALQAGLLVPDAKMCKKCHNAESPTFKGFDYTTAVKLIKHPLAPL